MIAWLQSHWLLVVLVLGVLISLLNAATRHWSEHTGVVRVLLYIADALSIIRSKGTSGDVLGNAKIPGVPTGSTGVVDGKHILMLVSAGLLAASMLTGCCSTARCYLAAGLEGLHKADKLVTAAVVNACKPKIQACGSVAEDKCPALQTCLKAIDVYKISANVAGRELDNCNATLSEIGAPK